MGTYESYDQPDFPVNTEKLPILNIVTPTSVILRGCFKQSYAFRSLKDRVPVILTKVIDQCHKDSSSSDSKDKPKGKEKSKTAEKGSKTAVNEEGPTSDSYKEYIKYVSKLKNDIATNKKYSRLKVDTKEAKRWNEWIQNTDSQYYFTNYWMFTECYMYRRLREGCELIPGLDTYDPFTVQKQEAFMGGLEQMCIVADRVVNMMNKSPKDQQKADFIMLLKLSLWANKCDLALTLGEPAAAPPDPFQMITDLKDKVLVDDSGKAFEQLLNKADAQRKIVDSAPPPPPPVEGENPGEGEIPPPPEEQHLCPAKIIVPTAVTFDIVCDNVGYELFTDLCIGHFLVSQNIVQRVRFHVKNIPWFISDVTPKDFTYFIEQSLVAEVPEKPPPPPAEDDTPPPPPAADVSPDMLHHLAETWEQFVQDGTFVVQSDSYWTSPHPYKEMKRYDMQLYRKLQMACMILFKGDLNYRKLLAEKNIVPTTGFEAALQGFIPSPIIAVRTVKSEIICALPKGKYEALRRIDRNWMEKGDYGVIHFCAKGEPLKATDRPCVEYGETCFGEDCAYHPEL